MRLELLTPAKGQIPLTDEELRKLKALSEVREGGPGSGRTAGSAQGNDPGRTPGSQNVGGGRADKPEVNRSVPFVGKVVNPNGWDTRSRFTYISGKYSTERAKVHLQIRDALFKGKTPVLTPTAYLIGGGPASGKSTLVKEGMGILGKNTVMINSDDIKTYLPEYNDAKLAGVLEPGTFVHEESSQLAKELAYEAGKGGYNLLLDGSGDGGIESLERKLNNMRASAQKVVGIYVTCPIKTALERNLSRAEKTGRKVPPSLLEETYKGVSRAVPKAIARGLFDEFTLYDSRKAHVVKVASATRTKLRVHDKKLWKEFLDQGR
jgi:predicted ABC-type ATPase